MHGMNTWPKMSNYRRRSQKLYSINCGQEGHVYKTNIGTFIHSYYTLPWWCIFLKHKIQCGPNYLIFYAHMEHIANKSDFKNGVYILVDSLFEFQLLGECHSWLTKESPRAHVTKFHGRLRLSRSIWRASNFPCFKIHWNCDFFLFITPSLLASRTLFWHFWHHFSPFQSWTFTTLTT